MALEMGGNRMLGPTQVVVLFELGTTWKSADRVASNLLISYAQAYGALSRLWHRGYVTRKYGTDMKWSVTTSGYEALDTALATQSKGT